MKSFNLIPDYDDDFQAIVKAIPKAVDDTWYGDSCPKFLAPLDNRMVVVYCEWKDPLCRDNFDSRFTMYYLKDYDDQYHNIIFSCETLEELIEEFPND